MQGGGNDPRRRGISPTASDPRSTKVRRVIYKRPEIINGPIGHIPERPRERLLAFLSGAEDDHVWDGEVLASLPRFLSVFKMTGETLGYKGQLPTLKDDLEMDGTAMSLYHSEQWIYLGLKNRAYRQNLIHQLNASIRQIVGEGLRPNIESIFMHIHSKNDVCDKCTVSLSKLMDPNNSVRNAFLKDLTGQDNFRNFLIIASSRVEYMGRRMKVGHDVSYAQCLRDQLDIFPDRHPDRVFPIEVTGLAITAIDINQFIRNNQFIHFVVPDWPAPQGKFTGRVQATFPFSALPVGGPRAIDSSAAAAAHGAGKEEGAEDEVIPDSCGEE